MPSTCNDHNRSVAGRLRWTALGFPDGTGSAEVSSELRKRLKWNVIVGQPVRRGANLVFPLSADVAPSADTFDLKTGPILLREAPPVVSRPVSRQSRRKRESPAVAPAPPRPKVSLPLVCLTSSNVLVSRRCAPALLKLNLTPALTKCLVSLPLCELLPLCLSRESLLRVLLACVVGVFKKSCLKLFAVHCVLTLPRLTASMRLTVCCVTASLTVILTLSSQAMAIACSLLSRRLYKHCVVSASHLLAYDLLALRPFEVTHMSICKVFRCRRMQCVLYTRGRGR